MSLVTPPQRRQRSKARAGRARAAPGVGAPHAPVPSPSALPGAAEERPDASALPVLGAVSGARRGAAPDRAVLSSMLPSKVLPSPRTTVLTPRAAAGAPEGSGLPKGAGPRAPAVLVQQPSEPSKAGARAKRTQQGLGLSAAPQQTPNPSPGLRRTQGSSPHLGAAKAADPRGAKAARAQPRPAKAPRSSKASKAPQEGRSAPRAFISSGEREEKPRDRAPRSRSRGVGAFCSRRCLLGALVAVVVGAQMFINVVVLSMLDEAHVDGTSAFLRAGQMMRRTFEEPNVSAQRPQATSTPPPPLAERPAVAAERAPPPRPSEARKEPKKAAQATKKAPASSSQTRRPEGAATPKAKAESAPKAKAAPKAEAIPKADAQRKADVSPTTLAKAQAAPKAPKAAQAKGTAFDSEDPWCLLEGCDTLHLTVTHNVGERLRQLAAAHWYVSQLGKRLHAVWPQDEHCPAAFEELFDPEAADFGVSLQGNGVVSPRGGYIALLVKYAALLPEDRLPKGWTQTRGAGGVEAKAPAHLAEDSEADVFFRALAPSRRVLLAARDVSRIFQVSDGIAIAAHWPSHQSSLDPNSEDYAIALSRHVQWALKNAANDNVLLISVPGDPLFDVMESTFPGQVVDLAAELAARLREAGATSQAALRETVTVAAVFVASAASEFEGTNVARMGSALSSVAMALYYGNRDARHNRPCRHKELATAPPCRVHNVR